MVSSERINSYISVWDVLIEIKFSTSALAALMFSSAISASWVKRPSLISAGLPLTIVARRIVSIDHVAADGLMIWSLGYDILTCSP